MTGTVALEAIARQVRAHVVDLCARPTGGHLGPSLSIVDILTALYFAVLDVDPARPAALDRDVFVLSKGHGALALYATLAVRGLLPADELASYARPGSRLLGHPTPAVPGVVAPTGALGHGLPLGVGLALAASYHRTDRRTVVLLGDGELQEGSVWEAVMSAAGLGLEQLVAIVDRNGLQLSGATERICPLDPLTDRWRSFGWEVRRHGGHDPTGLAEVLAATPWSPGRPSVLIADTVKGSGVPFAAGRVAAHYARLSPAQVARAHRALAAGRSRGGESGE